MGRRQLIPYRALANTFIDAVRHDLPPVRTCADTFGEPYPVIEKRIERMRLHGWLPPGYSSNTGAWHLEAQRLLDERDTSVVAAREAKAAAERAATELHQERELDAWARRGERRLTTLELRRDAREAARAARQAEREIERAERRRAREATWRTHDDWVRDVWERIDVRGEDECWPWLGARKAQGYGQCAMPTGCDENGKRTFVTIGAYRAAWITLRGAVPDGLHLDHMCHNRDLSCRGGVTCQHRLCCNPAHLEPVPTEVNSSRGRAGINFRELTHCCRGHPFAEHSYLAPNGRGSGMKRVCRECCRIRYENAKASSERRRERAALI